MSETSQDRLRYASQEIDDCMWEIHHRDPPHLMSDDSLDALKAAVRGLYVAAGEAGPSAGRRAHDQEIVEAAIERLDKAVRVAKDEALSLMLPHVVRDLTDYVDRIRACTRAGRGTLAPLVCVGYADDIEDCSALLSRYQWNGAPFPLEELHGAVADLEMACLTGDRHARREATGRLGAAVRKLCNAVNFTPLPSPEVLGPELFRDRSLGRLNASGAARARQQARWVATHGLGRYDPAATL